MNYRTYKYDFYFHIGLRIKFLIETKPETFFQEAKY